MLNSILKRNLEQSIIKGQFKFGFQTKLENAMLTDISNLILNEMLKHLFKGQFIPNCKGELDIELYIPFKTTFKVQLKSKIT